MKKVKDFIWKKIKSNDPMDKTYKFLIHFAICTAISFIAMELILGDSKEELETMEHTLNAILFFPF